MTYLIPIVVGGGYPLDVPRGIPPEFFAKKSVQIPDQLLKAIKEKTTSCVNRWGADQYDNCSIWAATKLATENPNILSPTRIRMWAKKELASFYEKYLKSSPSQKALGKYFILIQNLEKVLLTSKFGPSLKSKEIEQILAGIRKKTGLTHIPPPREKAVSWKEVEDSKESMAVRIQDIPIDLQEMAKGVKLPKEMANHLEIGDGNKTLWDFFVKNIDTVIFTGHIPSPYPAPMLAEAKTLFFKEAVLDINVNGARKLLGADFLIGLVSSLAHESYHNFFHHQLKRKNERFVDAYMLEERNASLLGSEVLNQHIKQGQKNGLDKNRLIKIVYYMANSLTPGIVANHCLQYQPYDRNLRTDISLSIDKGTLNKQPYTCLGAYLNSQGINSNEFFNKLMKELGLSEYTK